MTSEPPRHPFQFRLADLLILLLLDGILCTVILPHYYTVHQIIDPKLPYPSIGIDKPLHLAAEVIFMGTLGMLSGIATATAAAYYFGWRRTTQLCLAVPLGLWLGGISPALPREYADFVHVHFTPNSRSGDPGEEMCKSYCTAQQIYCRMGYDHDEIREYASHVNGEFGLADGNLMLVDRSFAAAIVEDDSPLEKPKCGYVFKMLKSQGIHAKGGKRNYVMIDFAHKAHMTGGYALLAAPAVYGGEHRKTYIVNQDDIIYSCDFGARTPEMFKKINEYDPDPAVWEIPD